MAQDLGKISITLEGEYNSNISYSRLDLVSYQGESYASKINNNAEPITNTLAWQKVAEKGSTGDFGLISFYINENMELISINTEVQEFNFELTPNKELIIV